jgi:D-amino-acid oxidase
MVKAKARVAVIGGGVIGLTSAYRLLEAGYAVTILARALSPHTTSDVAAAFWSPSATGGDGQSRAWALASQATFQEFAARPNSGIAIVTLYQLAPTPAALPYIAYAAAAKPVAPGQFPAPWSGYAVPVPRIDVPVYMPWLMAQVGQLGGIFHPHIVQRLSEVGADFDLIVNCSGLGARLLTGDEVYPIRGQVMAVRKPPGLADDIIYADSNHETTTYIIPRSRDCLLGGTYQYRNGNIEVDMATAQEILERCANFNPALRTAEILQHKVGLRPGRAMVRLATEQLRSGQPIIHNYGHGSIGHTLSWGCAAEVVERVNACLE